METDTYHAVLNHDGSKQCLAVKTSFGILSFTVGETDVSIIDFSSGGMSSVE